jgi:hypothetical protein
VDLCRVYALLFFEHGARRLHIAGVTAHPAGAWSVRQSRNLADRWGMRVEPPRFSIRDRDAKYTESLDAVFAADAIETVKTAPRTPRMNAYGERVIAAPGRRSSTTSCSGTTRTSARCSKHAPGIPPADRDRVFDRFVRLETARPRHKGPGTGTGLGLSLARDIVTAHGGTITVTDLPAGGPGGGVRGPPPCPWRAARGQVRGGFPASFLCL